MGPRLKGKGKKKDALHRALHHLFNFSKMNPGLVISDVPVYPISKQVMKFTNSLNSYHHIYTLG